MVSAWEIRIRLLHLCTGRSFPLHEVHYLKRKVSVRIKLKLTFRSQALLPLPRIRNVSYILAGPGLRADELAELGPASAQLPHSFGLTDSGWQRTENYD